MSSRTRKVRFAVIRTVDVAEVTLAVGGSIAELGCWHAESSVRLRPFGGGGAANERREPVYWHADIEIDAAKSAHLEYKFLAFWRDGCVEWEGCGETHNRTFVLDSDATDGEEDEESHWPPPTNWLDADGETNEMRHTRNFYFDVICADNGIHFSKMLTNLWLGSCPRQLYHVGVLRSLGATAVVSLQTAADVERNCRAVVAATQHGDTDEPLPQRLARLYGQNGLLCVWLPTDDMSSAARALVLPHAVFALHGLLAGGHRVYVHCNGGVGRAAAVVCGYLRYVRRMNTRAVQHFVAARRPAAYMDLAALDDAEADYRDKFAAASDLISAARPPTPTAT